MRIYALSILLLLFALADKRSNEEMQQQPPVYLQNASFEDQPQDATVPTDWHPCNPGTTPDILPGFWGVDTEPSDGETYVGLITREDGSRESIGQRLSAPLKQKECYQMVLDLAHSYTYAGYNKAIKLRVWGGQSLCDKAELLFQTEFIENEDWETFKFKFAPQKGDVKYLIFEAFYRENDATRRGNVLIDNIQPIKVCPRA
ncbi:MAG TPA: hypothetical protein ENJ88_07215 [Phaeodactylibacter sp.]|nr:hypothetical protein [Phaeodactylibacter sp.]